MKNLIPNWYLVKYTVYWKTYEETFSTTETESWMIEADFNTELDSRFYWENREILNYCRIQTPARERIPWLEEYYKMEDEQFKEEFLPF